MCILRISKNAEGRNVRRCSHRDSSVAVLLAPESLCMGLKRTESSHPWRSLRGPVQRGFTCHSCMLRKPGCLPTRGQISGPRYGISPRGARQRAPEMLTEQPTHVLASSPSVDWSLCEELYTWQYRVHDGQHKEVVRGKPGSWLLALGRSPSFLQHSGLPVSRSRMWAEPVAQPEFF